MVKELRLDPVMSDEAAEAIVGSTLSDRHCLRLVNYDADVYDAVTGKVRNFYDDDIIIYPNPMNGEK